jgi:putative membrane-bound dehydrogenase-like protein
MTPFAHSRRAMALPALLCICLALGAGPKVPEGFEVRLIATVPAVTFPCQVATAPDGSLFVAEDPMDQVGPYEAYHGRILRFRDGQDPVVFADGFRAIQGMAWRDGSLYVSHMPFLTIVKDEDGDGKAEKREHLFKDLGPTNNKGLNDHIVSGIQFGMDGWLYISVGDKGVPAATRLEDGRKVQIKGGGVLRCRPDGSGLEVFTTGTRNHLEANLDDRDNVITYDNTDDGDGWWTRVTHHVDGGYYGYPYDYHDYPDRFLPPMAEYGGGSPCGATFYKEDVWPEKYRNAGFWAEWGKGKVHAFRFAAKGSSYAVMEAIDFAVADGVDNFRPIDLSVSFDGKTMYIADWGMGSWGSKTEKVGRVWAVTYKEEVKSRPRGQDSDPLERQIEQLDHPSFNERMRAQSALVKIGRAAVDPVTRALADPKRDVTARRHLVWALDGLAGGGPEAAFPTVELLDAESAELRAQAARALGQREVPIAVEALVKRIGDVDPCVRLQAVIALGRIGDSQALPALLARLTDSDRYVAFSARQAVRRVNAWKAAALGLDSADAELRDALLRAMESIYDIDACRALAAHVANDRHPAEERARALMILARIHRRARPWDGAWWGTRPSQGSPPAKVEEWDGTQVALRTIRIGLTDPSAPLRDAAVSAVVETRDRDALSILRGRFHDEPDANVKRGIALALGKLGDKTALPVLVVALKDLKSPQSVRDAALSAMETIGGELVVKTLIDVLGQADLPVARQTRLIAALGRARAKGAIAAIVSRLTSPEPNARAAAAEALGQIGVTEGVAVPLRSLIEDQESAVSRAAISALAALKDRDSVPAILAAADREPTRFEAGLALTQFGDPRAMPVLVRNLSDKNPDIRKASAGALRGMRAEAIPFLEKLSERHELSPAVIPELQRVFTSVKPLTSWRILGPFPKVAKIDISADKPIDFGATHSGFAGKPVAWKKAEPVDDQGQLNLGMICGTNEPAIAYGYAEFESLVDRRARMVVGSDDTLTVWLNGEKVYEFTDQRGFEHEQARVDVRLRKGTNSVVIKCGNEGGGWQFAVSATMSADYAFLKAPAEAAFNPDLYRAFALEAKGRPDRGQSLFADLKGLACVKCHTLAGQGGTVGPDLTGIGGKYPREELIQSILFPSQRIFSGYEPVVVATTDGRVLTGILKSDTPEALELQDADAKTVRVPKSDIEARKVSDVSIMPTGLAEGLSKQDFADLIAFLEGLKEAPSKPKAGD